MPAPYASSADLKARFSIDDSVDDALITMALDGASRKIDQHCQRVFYNTAAVTATFVANNPYRLILADTDVWVGDAVSVTSLATDESGDGTFETSWAATDYQLWPPNAALGPEPRPYTEVRAVAGRIFPVPYERLRRADRVQIIGTFGWPTAVPVDVREACLVVAGELFKMKDAPFGVAGFGAFGAIRVRDNPLAVKLLEPYERDRVKVA